MYIKNYLGFLSVRNAFGLTPYGLYLENHRGDRQVDEFWYRYFMDHNAYSRIQKERGAESAAAGVEWWLGTNFCFSQRDRSG
jgi:hypothetical protein